MSTTDYLRLNEECSHFLTSSSFLLSSLTPSLHKLGITIPLLTSLQILAECSAVVSPHTLVAHLSGVLFASALGPVLQLLLRKIVQGPLAELAVVPRVLVEGAVSPVHHDQNHDMWEARLNGQRPC